LWSIELSRGRRRVQLDAHFGRIARDRLALAYAGSVLHYQGETVNSFAWQLGLDRRFAIGVFGEPLPGSTVVSGHVQIHLANA